MLHNFIIIILLRNYKMLKYFIAQIKKYLNIKIFLFVNIENFTQTLHIYQFNIY